MGDIGDRDIEDIALFCFADEDGVIEILCIFAVDGDVPQHPQVNPVRFDLSIRSHCLCRRLGFLSEPERQAVLILHELGDGLDAVQPFQCLYDRAFRIFPFLGKFRYPGSYYVAIVHLFVFRVCPDNEAIGDPFIFGYDIDQPFLLLYESNDVPHVPPGNLYDLSFFAPSRCVLDPGDDPVAMESLFNESCRDKNIFFVLLIRDDKSVPAFRAPEGPGHEIHLAGYAECSALQPHHRTFLDQSSQKPFQFFPGFPVDAEPGDKIVEA